jgi:hypothetical protein
LLNVLLDFLGIFPFRNEFDPNKTSVGPHDFALTPDAALVHGQREFARQVHCSIQKAEPRTAIGYVVENASHLLYVRAENDLNVAVNPPSRASATFQSSCEHCQKVPRLQQCK